ncbi:patatin-like phospholipase family protein [Dolichospermum sp. ST_sed3]|nr:patatin-like phospholipase family protein [Dolichospermum sp. ST_sed3]
MTLGEFIKNARTEKKISAKSLSKKLGSEASYISKVESGIINPSKDKLQQILDIIDIPNDFKAFLLLEKNKFSEHKKEVFEALKPAIFDLIADLVTNGKTHLNKIPNIEENDNIALIMKGGGIKGIAYIGALEELSKHYNFNWFIGTSAGAISAILLASGYTILELKKILLEKNFDDFRDARLLKAIYNLVVHKGLYKAESFTNWISRLLAEKIESPYEVTLEEIPKRVTVYACMRDRNALIFDSFGELKHSHASYATRCSMSIPMVFMPQKYQGINVYDGGMKNDYPVSILLKDHPKTDYIGLYLGSPIFERSKIKNGLLSDLFSIWSEANDIENLKQHKNKTIIIDPKPISTLDLTLTFKEKDFLMQSGKVAAILFLRKNKKINLSDAEVKLMKESLESMRKDISKCWHIKRTYRFIKSTILN